MLNYRLVLVLLTLLSAIPLWVSAAEIGPSSKSDSHQSDSHLIPALDTHLIPDRALRDTHLIPIRDTQSTLAQALRDTHLIPIRDTQLTLAQALRDTHLIPIRTRLAEASSPSATATNTDPFGDLISALGSLLKWFLILCFLAFLLFLLVVALVLWKAKQLVANAVKSDPVALSKLVDRLRRKHPELDDRALCRKIILRQSNRAGLVGFITGVGGLPTLPLALPIDIAATIRIQANMVHMLRLVKDVHEDEVPEAGLWLATTGGIELATAGSTALREVVVKIISKSLLKFLPLIGGVIGFGLNWASTQTMGRLGLKYMDRSKIAPPAPVAVDRDLDADG